MPNLLGCPQYDGPYPEVWLLHHKSLITPGRAFMGSAGVTLPMKRLLLVTDPIGGSTSVQFEILGSLAKGLGSRYELTVYTPYCAPDRARALAESGCGLITPRADGFNYNRLLRARGRGNESMLWAESWTREALLGKNGWDASTCLRTHQSDYVVNLSMTVPAACDLWWILGTPLDQTIRGMAGANLVARMADALAGGLVTSLDGKVLQRIRARALRIVANSPYLRDLYRDRGFPVEGVVYTLKDLSEFQPTSPQPTRDYVLLYVGKELDHLDFPALLRAGVRVVGFGNKIPSGTRLNGLSDSIEWLGPVSHRKLIDLYANALFTLFPFTCEPMGLVPIESMSCGTPVLTYGRQGPASTVVNGSTGWLVNTPDEMVAKATEIWRRGDSGISPDPCILRARSFTGQRMVDELVDWIEGACPIEPPTARVANEPWEMTHVAPAAMGHA
jgi:glycosyltransferase involved in cell wall biosynthesis